MSAYYGDFGAYFRIYFYNDLTKKIKYKGTVNTKKEADKIVADLNKEWESNFNIDVKNWAKRHMNNLEKIEDIAKDCKVPQTIIRRELKKYKSDWYNYDIANKNRYKKEQKRFRDKRLRGYDKVTASVYNTFIKTMKSIGKTENQAWEEIYKITGKEKVYE